MRVTRFARCAGVALALAVLTACGGGNGNQDQLSGGSGDTPQTFDVDRGLLQTQAQQICSVDPSEGQLCVIGDVATKLVCTTHVPEEDWMANLRELIPRLQREQAEKEAARMRDD